VSRLLSPIRATWYSSRKITAYREMNAARLDGSLPGAASSSHPVRLILP
jgi:hypothetical protein